MNPPPPGFNRLQSDELKEYLLNKQGKGPLFTFLYYSAIIFLIQLISILKPHRFYKKILVFILDLKIKIGNYKYKLIHCLFFVIAFYTSLYFFLQMQGRQAYPNKMDPYRVKMEKLDKKWVIDAQSWLAFLCIACLLGIYKNGKLFNSEVYLQRKIEEYDKELKLKKN